MKPLMTHVRRCRARAVFAAMFSLFGAVAHADDGALDPTFANGGIGYVEWPGYFYDQSLYTDVPIGVFAQADSKIIAVSAVEYTDGSTAYEAIGLARFNNDGTFDSSFGNGAPLAGEIVIPAPAGVTWYPKSAVQTPSGEIVIAGQVGIGTYTYPSVWKITPNGALDPSFGGGSGNVVIDRGVADPTDGANALVVGDGSNEPEGTVFVAGSISNSDGSETDPAIFFLAADGTPLSKSLSVGNATLPNGGRFWTVPGACPSDTTTIGTFVWRSIAFNTQYFVGNSTHYLVVAGDCFSGPNTNEVVVAALGSQSNLDSTFGANGMSYLAFGTDFGKVVDNLAAMTVSYGLAGAEQITVAGIERSYTSFATHFGLARLKSNGQFDTTFGSAGHVTIDVGQCCGATTGSSLLFAMLIQRDGKTVVAGSTEDASGVISRALLRLDTEGIGDPTFGTTGTLVGGRVYREPVSGLTAPDYITAISFMSGEKILQTGPSWDSGSNTYTGLARVQNDSIFVASFDPIPVPPTGGPR